MQVSLVVVQGKPEGMEIPLRTARLFIGRDSQCHVRPRNELVSKMHCEISQRENSVF
ncbi:MAG: FHA domain-containing protein [Planctomycetes bacterium]|nr:FHA domain-containing protein [Planctomycetota bacterium]